MAWAPPKFTAERATQLLHRRQVMPENEFIISAERDPLRDVFVCASQTGAHYVIDAITFAVHDVE